MTNEPVVKVQGRDWYLFTARFESEGKPYGFYFYALSQEHAEIMMAGIRASATIEGQVVSFVAAGEDSRPDEVVH